MLSINDMIRNKYNVECGPPKTNKVAKQIPKKVEPNNIYSPEGSIPFKHYFHGTQIKIKSSQNQKKETKKIQKKRQANIKWTHAFKKKKEKKRR